MVLGVYLTFHVVCIRCDWCCLVLFFHVLRLLRIRFISQHNYLCRISESTIKRLQKPDRKSDLRTLILVVVMLCWLGFKLVMVLGVFLPFQVVCITCNWCCSVCFFMFSSFHRLDLHHNITTYVSFANAQ